MCEVEFFWEVCFKKGSRLVSCVAYSTSHGCQIGNLEVFSVLYRIVKER